MKKKQPELTEMQRFAMNFLKGKGKVNPSYLGSEWYAHKNNGRYRSGGSRGAFGSTSAAYRTLRKLAEMKLIIQHHSRTSGGYSLEHFSLK